MSNSAGGSPMKCVVGGQKLANQRICGLSCDHRTIIALCCVLRSGTTMSAPAQGSAAGSAHARVIFRGAEAVRDNMTALLLQPAQPASACVNAAFCCCLVPPAAASCQLVPSACCCHGRCVTHSYALPRPLPSHSFSAPTAPAVTTLPCHPLPHAS
jgi:hypothetical protein